jgi:hypothetical protein
LGCDYLRAKVRKSLVAAPLDGIGILAPTFLEEGSMSAAAVVAPGELPGGHGTSAYRISPLRRDGDIV